MNLKVNPDRADFQTHCRIIMMRDLFRSVSVHLTEIITVQHLQSATVFYVITFFKAKSPPHVHISAEAGQLPDINTGVIGGAESC